MFAHGERVRRRGTLHHPEELLAVLLLLHALERVVPFVLAALVSGPLEDDLVELGVSDLLRETSLFKLLHLQRKRGYIEASRAYAVVKDATSSVIFDLLFSVNAARFSFVQ
jgi:L-fucose mutarotase/ribose pyranase (RbsD/FucU family)